MCCLHTAIFVDASDCVAFVMVSVILYPETILSSEVLTVELHGYIDVPERSAAV